MDVIKQLVWQEHRLYSGKSHVHAEWELVCMRLWSLLVNVHVGKPQILTL